MLLPLQSLQGSIDLPGLFQLQQPFLIPDVILPAFLMKGQLLLRLDFLPFRACLADFRLVQRFLCLGCSIDRIPEIRRSRTADGVLLYRKLQRGGGHHTGCLSRPA